LAKNAFLLILARFANFKAKRNKTAEKNEKHILYCKRVLFYIHFRGLRGSILSKKSKVLYPTTEYS
jgi:hypothetical protein